LTTVYKFLLLKLRLKFKFALSTLIFLMTNVVRDFKTPYLVYSQSKAWKFNVHTFRYIKTVFHFNKTKLLSSVGFQVILVHVSMATPGQTKRQKMHWNLTLHTFRFPTLTWNLSLYCFHDLFRKYVGIFVTRVNFILVFKTKSINRATLHLNLKMKSSFRDYASVIQY
jgi:hypothetical protein